jgi:regulator of protease activity HflC (stomatin/prohibitin superfamily)
MSIPVNVTNLYDIEGTLKVAEAQGEGFTIRWKIGDEYGAIMDDIIYAQINRLAAMAQFEPLPDDLMQVMTHLIAAKRVLDASAAEREAAEQERLAALRAEADAQMAAARRQQEEAYARAAQGADIDAAEAAFVTPVEPDSPDAPVA